MSPLLRNVLAVIAGFVVGSFVNMGILSLSATLIPPPTDADVTTTEGLKASMHLFEPKHFVFPFLAHALGTLAGAAVAACIAATRKFQLAMTIGVVFLAGGIGGTRRTEFRAGRSRRRSGRGECTAAAGDRRGARTSRGRWRARGSVESDVPRVMSWRTCFWGHVRNVIAAGSGRPTGRAWQSRRRSRRSRGRCRSRGCR